MKRLFDMENPLMRTMAVACDLLVLNLLAILCCLPVVTAGASLTALFDISIHMVRGEEGYIFKPFFRSFAGNLKKGSLMGVLFLLAAVILVVDYQAASFYIPMLRAGAAALLVILLAIALYAFALLSRYENTVFRTLKNAAALAVGFFPRTLGMTAFTVALWILGFRFYQVGAPVLLMFGLSLPSFVSALLLKGVFHEIDKTEP